MTPLAAAGNGAIVLGALAAGLATAYLQTGTRTVALAVLGGMVVAAAEVASRLADRRSWRVRLSWWRELAPGLGLAVGGALAGFLVVEAAGATAVQNWSVLAAGGAGALAVLLAVAAMASPASPASPSGPQPSGAGPALRSGSVPAEHEARDPGGPTPEAPPAAPAPWLRGRRRGRGTRPARPDRPGRRAPSSG